MKSSGYQLVVLVLGLVLSACAAPKAPAPLPSSAPAQAPAPSPAPAPSEWDKILAAAKKEGTVTLYTVWGVDANKAIGDGFTQAYGIKVEVVGMTGSEMRARVNTEQRAKTYVADVAGGGWRNNRDFAADGVHEPVTVALPAAQEEGVFFIPPFKYAPDRFAAVVSYQMTPVLLINTDQVGGDEVQSLYDLLNPKWKGRIVMGDPRISGPGNAVLMMNMGLEDFWPKLAQQNVLLERSYDRTIDMALLGEKAIAMGLSPSRVLRGIKAGAPGKIVHPKEGTATFVRGAGVVKNAPHPNAALVLVNWLLTKEGQTAMHKAAGELVLRKDMAADWVYPAMRFDAAKKLLEPPAGTESDEIRNAANAFALKIFGKP